MNAHRLPSAQHRSPRHWLFGKSSRPSTDFSDIRYWTRLQEAWSQISQRARPNSVQRLAEEVQHYQAAELPLEQVTALHQIRHLLPLAERDLLQELERDEPCLKREQAAQAVELILLARSLLNPEKSDAAASTGARAPQESARTGPGPVSVAG